MIIKRCIGIELYVKQVKQINNAALIPEAYKLDSFNLQTKRKENIIITFLLLLFSQLDQLAK
jgi:hypothetical protein